MSKFSLIGFLTSALRTLVSMTHNHFQRHMVAGYVAANNDERKVKQDNNLGKSQSWTRIYYYYYYYYLD